MRCQQYLFTPTKFNSTVFITSGEWFHWCLDCKSLDSLDITMYISPNVNTHSDILRLGDLYKKEKSLQLDRFQLCLKNTSRREIANITVLSNRCTCLLQAQRVPGGRKVVSPKRRKYCWYSGPKCGGKNYVNDKFCWHYRESNPRPSGL
jgi:hypothetical protein